MGARQWICISAVFVAVLLIGASCFLNSAGVDEVGHLAAGLSHLQFGEFDLYRVNPPLVRTMVSCGVFALSVPVDWSKYDRRPDVRAEFDVGFDLFESSEASTVYLPLARLTALPFFFIGAWTCFAWGKSLGGLGGGTIATILWSFSPNILAHAAMITPDCGATALGIAAAFAFWSWLKSPSWCQAMIGGILLGLAELTKFTWIILFALWPLLWLVCPQTESARAVNRIQTGTQLVLMLILAIYVINIGYGFEGSCQALGEFEFVSEALGGSPRERPNAFGNRFRETWLHALPFPLPKNYLQGIDVQKRDFERQFPSYLHGRWQNRGWWYYYGYALLIKEPVGYWAIFLLALIKALFGNRNDSTWLDDLVLLSPGLCVLGLVSSQTGFNHHLRYVLPALPCIYIWVGGQLGRLLSKGVPLKQGQPANAMDKLKPSCSTRRLRVSMCAACLIVASLVCGVVSSMLQWPHSLSYFNEAAGGPLNGHASLVDSNIDWGQDLFYLREWLDRHPEARPLAMAYFGGFDPRAIGIDYHLPPNRKSSTRTHDNDSKFPEEVGPRPGWYAVSVNFLRGMQFPVSDGMGGRTVVGESWYTYFLEHCRPTARAGYSIYIYHLTHEEASHVRSKLGLKPL